MSKRSPAVIGAVVLVVGLFSACRASLAPGVTCDGVRALRIGMTQAEVSGILGPPVRSFFLFGPGDIDPLVWDYNFYSDNDLFGGVEFNVRFTKSKLNHASIYATPLRDSALMTSFNSKGTLLYWLDEKGDADERPAFAEYLNCR